MKNIADPDERAAAQRRSEGPRPLAADTPAGHDEGLRRRAAAAGPARHLPAGDGLPAAGRGRPARRRHVQQRRRHGRALDRRLPAARRQRADRLPARPGRAARPRASGCSRVDAHAFDDAPFAGEVRKRLAAALDDGPGRRPAGRGRCRWRCVRHADGRVTWSGSDVVFGDATRANPNFTLLPEALVTRVLVEDGRVTGVGVRDLRDGGEHEVRARFVVVAADALRTPQLLWASGVRPRALGRYLNDQPQTVFAVRLRDVDAARRGRASTPRDEPEIVPQSGVSWVPYTDEDAVPRPGDAAGRVAGPAGRRRRRRRPARSSGWAGSAPRTCRSPTGSSSTTTEADGYGMPAMRIHYRLTERDHASIAAARETVRRLAAALGEPLDDRPPLTFPPGASLHYQGTVRMGPDRRRHVGVRPDQRGLGRRRPATWPATASSRPPPPATPPSPPSRSPSAAPAHIAAARPISPRRN